MQSHTEPGGQAKWNAAFAGRYRAAVKYVLPLMLLAAGCTVIRTDSRTFQVGVGHRYERTTEVEATDAKRTDFTPNIAPSFTGQMIRLPDGRYHLPGRQGGATVPSHSEAVEVLRTGGVEVR